MSYRSCQSLLDLGHYIPPRSSISISAPRGFRVELQSRWLIDRHCATRPATSSTWTTSDRIDSLASGIDRGLPGKCPTGYIGNLFSVYHPIVRMLQLPLQRRVGTMAPQIALASDVDSSKLLGKMWPYQSQRALL